MKYSSKQFLALLLSVTMAITPATGVWAENVSPEVSTEKTTEAVTEKATEKAVETVAEKVTKKTEENETKTSTEKAEETQSQKKTETETEKNETKIESDETVSVTETEQKETISEQDAEESSSENAEETSTEAVEADTEEMVTEAAETGSETETENMVLDTVETEVIEEKNLAAASEEGNEEVTTATGITLDVSEKTILVGNSFSLNATITPDNTTETVTWSSSDDKVVTVDSGTVKAISAGTATITAEVGAYKAECEITVKDNDSVQKTYAISVTAVMNANGQTSGMYAMGNAVATEQTDGTWLVRIQQTSKKRNYMAITDDADAATAHSVDWYVSDADYYYTIPVKDITAPLLVCFSSDTRVAKGDAFSNIVKLTFDAENKTETDERAASADDINILAAETEEAADYTAVDKAIASVPADLTIYTEETANAVKTAVSAVVRGYAKEKQSEVDKMAEDILTAVSNLKLKEETKSEEETVLTDGVYQTTATTNAAMFKVISVKINITDGNMQALITLSGTGYDYLYMGTSEEAASSSTANRISEYSRVDYISETGKQKTGSCFEIPVTALDVPIAVAAHSVGNDTWYDRTITFSSEDMKKIEDSSSEESGAGTTETEKVTEKETEETNDKTADKESKYEADTSGATSAVDSSTGLADGVYTPDKFSWSGGSGRTSISCTKVTVSGGQAYATIVFGSSNYGYVKANGRKYYPTYSGGTSIFTIPVKLNANNQIIGMTTAMSAAHEVTYTIYIYIAGADKASDSKEKELNKDGLSEESPEIIGLEYTDEEKIEYAEYFKIYYYDQGITLIEVDMASDTDKPEKEEADAEESAGEAVSEAELAEETAAAVSEEEMAEGATEEIKDATTIISELYQEKVVRYLVVPETAEVPVGLEKEMIIVNLPVESVYTDSEQAMETLEKLELEELVTVEGETAEKPEYKELVLNKCDLAILSDEFLWDEEKEELTQEEQSELLYEITERLTTLGIPAIVDRSADEKSEEAAAEWAKVYGVLFGCSDAAEALFQEAVQN